MAENGAEPAVLLEISRGIAQVILNRPAKYNTMNRALASDFRKAVTEIAARDDVGAIVFSARGAAFCAGGDVSPMLDSENLQTYLTELADDMHAGIELLSTLPIVVIVAVNGVVAGGGLGLVLTGDLVVSSPAATFIPAYAGLGYTPDCGVTKHLPETVGLRRALRFSVGGEKLSADTALEWGIVSEIVSEGAVLARALELAAAVNASAPAALGSTRALLRSSFDRDLKSSLDLEAATIVDHSAGAESVDLIAAFAAARRARR